MSEMDVHRKLYKYAEMFQQSKKQKKSKPNNLGFSS